MKYNVHVIVFCADELASLGDTSSSENLVDEGSHLSHPANLHPVSASASYHHHSFHSVTEQVRAFFISIVNGTTNIIGSFLNNVFLILPYSIQIS
jgi:hypothetical protein